jgi:hypothetical protein
VALEFGCGTAIPPDQNIQENLKTWKSQQHWDTDVKRVEREVRGLTRGLIEVQLDRVQFIHESVRQFFSSFEVSLYDDTMVPIRSCLLAVQAMQLWKKIRKPSFHYIKWYEQENDEASYFRWLESYYTRDLLSIYVA